MVDYVLSPEGAQCQLDIPLAQLGCGRRHRIFSRPFAFPLAVFVLGLVEHAIGPLERDLQAAMTVAIMNHGHQSPTRARSRTSRPTTTAQQTARISNPSFIADLAPPRYARTREIPVHPRRL